MSYFFMGNLFTPTKPRFVTVTSPSDLEKAKEKTQEIDSIWARRGTRGDSFGAVNVPFFSGFAFAGLIYTIILQRADRAATQKNQYDKI